MANLDELEKELYQTTGAKETEKRMKWRVSFPKLGQNSRTAWGEEERKEEPKPRSFRKAFLAIALLGGFLFVAGGGLFIYLYLSTRGEEATVTIRTESSIDAGESLTIPITLKNTSRSILEQVELSVILPERSILSDEGGDILAPSRILKKLDDLGPQEERTIELHARLFGKEGEDKKIEGMLLYRPRGLSARFSSRVSKNVTIRTVPLALHWELTDTIRHDQEMEATLRYVSNAAYSFENMSIRIDYPNGFSVTSTDPKPDEKTGIWNLGTIESGREGKITIHGTLSGETGERKGFGAGIGFFDAGTKGWTPYAETSQEAHIAANPLSVQGFIEEKRDKVIVPGERLRFTLRYKNQSAVGIHNVSIHARFEAVTSGGKVFPGAQNVLDPPTLAVEKGGVFDSQTQSIVWEPGGTPELKEVLPDAGGELSFSITTRSSPVIRSSEEKNFSLRLVSNIDTPITPDELQGTDLSSSDQVLFKTSTKIIFDGKAVFRSAFLPGNGPLPPRVGEKTTYTILLEARNFINDLFGTDVVISLPPNVKWENVSSPSNVSITFEKSSGELRWNIGTLNAGTGVLTAALRAAFQVSVTPSDTDVGKSITLARSVRFVGRDAVTGEIITKTLEQINTELTSDPLTTANDWRVVR